MLLTITSISRLCMCTCVCVQALGARSDAAQKLVQELESQLHAVSADREAAHSTAQTLASDMQACLHARVWAFCMCACICCACGWRCWCKSRVHCILT